MEKLLSLGQGIRKVKYYLSDEVLCLGCPNAPVTSEFSRPLVYLEAYKRGEAPSSAQVYMTARQAAWLADELFAAMLGSVSDRDKQRSRMTFDDLDTDKSRVVRGADFEAARKVSFKDGVVTFRRRCGLPITTPLMQKGATKQMKETRLEKGKETGSAAVAPIATAGVTKKPELAEPASTPQVKDLPSASQSHKSTARLPEKPLSPPPSFPTSFAGLTKAERAARMQAYRDAVNAHHVATQKAALPQYRNLYSNIERLGGAALSCDVESWTEDANVLLELGMAWYTWAPGQTVDESERDGGSQHYSERPSRAV
jgi:hypothetical protein